MLVECRSALLTSTTYQLNCCNTAILRDALKLSTRTNVSQFVSQYDVSTEFLLSIGKLVLIRISLTIYLFFFVSSQRLLRLWFPKYVQKLP